MADTPMKKLQLGQRPAYPVGGYPGMTYRQWLIGQAVTVLPVQQNPTAIATYAIQIADTICVALEIEELDTQIEEEKGRGETP